VETVIECEYADIIFTDFCRCRVVRDGEVIEKFEDNSEHRTYMLESIADSYVGGSDFRGDIKNCRAFTLSVNCAYESSRGVERIDEIYIDKQKYNDTIKRVISDIDEAIREAHNSGSLLSQTGLDWTVSKEPFDCAGYDRFPVWREMEESLCKKMTTIRI
jgi:hypothetical protein